LAFAEGDHDEHEGEEMEHEEEEAHEEGEHGHSGADPHVWFSVHNVEQWAENVEQVLSDLDPANATTFEANAAAYVAALEELEAYAEAELANIPSEKRFLVTNHDSLGYFAEEYGFTLLGTVIPSMSTLSEPSASDLTDLITEMEAHNVCTIFTETTLNDTLAQTVAGELDGCDEVQVFKLYTGAIGLEGSGADSYIGMFRANVDAIVSGLNSD
jgi:ABC-type Zn uptake system ZnuABC Zn-binding protein ZnuA